MTKALYVTTSYPGPSSGQKSPAQGPGCVCHLSNFLLDLYTNSQVPGNKMVIKSSPLTTPCELIMSDHDVHLMQAFRVQLQQVGITFADPSSSDTLSSVHIKTVPSLFLAREFSENGEKLRTEIKNCIEVHI